MSPASGGRGDGAGVVARTARGARASDRATAPVIDVGAVRAEFPILAATVRGRPLVYLDNAATAQKPRSVIDAVARYYAAENANIHRGVHWLSEQATARYDAVRAAVQRFLNAREAREIVFVRGTTEGINLVATSVGQAFVRTGDEIVITAMEHHSNIVPWQMLCERTGAALRVAPVTDGGELDLDALEGLLGARTRLVAVTHISNAIGTVNPVARIVAMAHAHGVPVLVDGAQSAPHVRVDVQALDCDFFVCSGHKLYGPTGIGVLYGKAAWLEQMPPYQGGGDMIESVAFDRSTYAPLPAKFEAGTPNIAGVVGLGAALAYVDALGFDAIEARERALTAYAVERLAGVRGIRLVGTPRERASIVAFTLDGVHPHDVGTILDGDGIAIRAGHHCAQPLLRRLGCGASARASFAFYNTPDEIDALVRALETVREIFG